MKNIVKTFLVLSLFVAAASQAAIFPGWERPILRSNLVEVFTHAPFQYPVARTLTMHRRDESRRQATSFSLVEDTGIRCFRAPCPSTVTTKFSVTNIQELDAFRTQFTAVSGKYNRFGRFMIDRTLTVVQSNFDHKLRWNVSITKNRTRKNYVGSPEGVITPQ